MAVHCSINTYMYVETSKCVVRSSRHPRGHVLGGCRSIGLPRHIEQTHARDQGTGKLTKMKPSCCYAHLIPKNAYAPWRARLNPPKCLAHVRPPCPTASHPPQDSHWLLAMSSWSSRVLPSAQVGSCYRTVSTQEQRLPGYAVPEPSMARARIDRHPGPP